MIEQNVRPHKCPRKECYTVYDNEKSLSRHVKASHNKDAPNKCKTQLVLQRAGKGSVECRTVVKSQRETTREMPRILVEAENLPTPPIKEKPTSTGKLPSNNVPNTNLQILQRKEKQIRKQKNPLKKETSKDSSLDKKLTQEEATDSSLFLESQKHNKNKYKSKPMEAYPKGLKRIKVQSFENIQGGGVLFTEKSHKYSCNIGGCDSTFNIQKDFKDHQIRIHNASNQIPSWT